jgi:NDP-sugar pyrophosphorylase family protein
MNNTKIAILCGGRGKRLKPLTNDLPKPLIPLQGKPILEYVLNYFENKGFCNFILCTGYKGHKIIDFIEQYKKKSESNFSISDLGNDASILERIYALKDFFSDRIFCTYGDTLTDLDLIKMFEMHIKKKTLMTIVSSKIKNPFGLLETDNNGLVTSFIEKPVFNYYIGHFLMEKETMNIINNNMLKSKDGKGLILLFSNLIEHKSLNVFEHHGAQITFNTEIEHKNAEKEIIDFYSQKEEEK